MIDKIEILKEDITKIECDAIVNAANKYLQEGGGVCGAIFKAAGSKELQAECDLIGGCKTGSAVITNGYKLKAKYVIHAVGPIYRDDSSAVYLESVYKSIIELAEKYKLESIAIPSISTGIYGYPVHKAVKIVFKAISNSNSLYLKKIYLVCFDSNTFDLYKMELNKYKYGVI